MKVFDKVGVHEHQKAAFVEFSKSGHKMIVIVEREVMLRTAEKAEAQAEQQGKE